MIALPPRLARLRAEIRGNRRLRLGLGLVAVILVAYGTLVLAEWRQQLHTEYVERRQYLRKLRDVAKQDEWTSRAATAAAARKALEASLPQARSLGLAQATAQEWIRDVAAVHGDAIRIESRPAEPAQLQGVYRIPVVVSGTLAPQAVINLLRQIEERPATMVVEQAMILNRQNKTFELTVVALVRVPGGDADAPG